MASSIPGWRNLPESQYDLETYWGRVRHAAEVSDPRTLFVTKTELESAKDLIYQYKNGKTTYMTPALWQAKKVLDSTLHPDTGTPVFLPFRMSCFAFSNLVVTAGMLTPNLGAFGTAFWQFANQSVNVAFNTANANKSHPLTKKQLLTSYALAVSASVSVALGLNSIVPRLKKLNPTTRTVLSRLVPFAAVISAGLLNIFLMRSEEIKRGIDVYEYVPHSHHNWTKQDDERTLKQGQLTISQNDDLNLSNSNSDTKKPLGKSKIAAFDAVSETAISRIINATPIMVVPPMILMQLQKTILKGKSNLVITLTNLVLIFTSSLAVIPFALGAFPQKKVMNVKTLESEFHNLYNAKGEKIEKVQFNRGM